MFDQVLDEVFLIAMGFIFIPSVVIAAILMIIGRRKINRSDHHSGAAEIGTSSPHRWEGRGVDQSR